MPSPSGRAWEPVPVSTAAPQRSVEELFRRARSGSPEAWEELYLAARPQLFRFARVRLATDDQADDAVSETIARAMAAAGRYRPGSGVLPWLVGICRNVVFETYRSGGRLHSVDPSVFVDQPSLSGDQGPAEHAVAEEQAESIRKAFARLTEEDQEILALRVLVGLDAEAVAEAVGKRAGAVRMAQSRALVRLRGHLEEAT